MCVSSILLSPANEAIVRLRGRLVRSAIVIPTRVSLSGLLCDCICVAGPNDAPAGLPSRRTFAGLLKKRVCVESERRNFCSSCSCRGCLTTLTGGVSGNPAGTSASAGGTAFLLPTNEDARLGTDLEAKSAGLGTALPGWADERASADEGGALEDKRWRLRAEKLKEGIREILLLDRAEVASWPGSGSGIEEGADGEGGRGWKMRDVWRNISARHSDGGLAIPRVCWLVGGSCR